MKRLTAVLAALMMGGSVGAAVAAEAPEAKKLVERFEQYRGYDEDFAFTLTNIADGESRERSRNELRVYVSGRKSLVQFRSPARVEGRAILKRGNDMWLYITDTRNVLRVSPTQRIIGETSIGDVVGTDYSGAYSATVEGEADVDGTPTWKLRLKTREGGQTYPEIVLWLEQRERHRPVKAEYYSGSGRILKKVYFSQFRTFNGNEFVYSMKLVDALREGNFTWMRFDGYDRRDLSDAWFRKNQLGSVTVD